MSVVNKFEYTGRGSTATESYEDALGVYHGSLPFDAGPLDEVRFDTFCMRADDKEDELWLTRLTVTARG